MGGLTIETVAPGVQFIPDAAAAFRRANAQVRAEFGRDIDVNSTYRSWADQMLMFENWERYVAGKGPHPGHSKAVHPRDSFHVAGTALDSDDWRNARIVEILADNGFIRNRLYVKGEDHHFEWIKSRDNHYGEPIAADPQEDLPMNIMLYLYTPTNSLILVDHLNKTMRNLGNNPKSWIRSQYEKRPYQSVGEPDWTNRFSEYRYV